MHLGTVSTVHRKTIRFSRTGLPAAAGWTALSGKHTGTLPEGGRKGDRVHLGRFTITIPSPRVLCPAPSVHQVDRINSQIKATHTIRASPVAGTLGADISDYSPLLGLSDTSAFFFFLSFFVYFSAPGPIRRSSRLIACLQRKPLPLGLSRSPRFNRFNRLNRFVSGLQGYEYRESRSLSPALLGLVLVTGLDMRELTVSLRDKLPHLPLTFTLISTSRPVHLLSLSPL